MKRLVVLALAAVVVVPLAGCNNSWPRNFCFRGDPCNTCTPMEVAPIYTGEMLQVPVPAGQQLQVPVPGVQQLPGPAETQPST
jgi:hypothetical protein